MNRPPDSTQSLPSNLINSPLRLAATWASPSSSLPTSSRAFFWWRATASFWTRLRKASSRGASRASCATNRRFHLCTTFLRARRQERQRIKEGNLMSVERNYGRLGLFIAIALIVILGTAVLIIQRLRTREAIAFVTYTTEDVTGLDVSSPVRLVGVAVGRVTGMRVDPGAGTVEIDFEVFTDRLTQLGVSVSDIRKRIDFGGLSPNLRTHLMGNPVTGEAHLVVDRPKSPPPPIELGFTPTRPYIPSMPSPIKTIEDRLPPLLERAEAR